MLLDRRSGNADGASSTPRVVFFDLGNVVMPWSPRRLYAELMPDVAMLDWFTSEVITVAVNEEMDRGRPHTEVLGEVALAHPDHAELIWTFWDRWPETLADPIAGTVAIIDELGAAGVPRYALSNFATTTFERIVDDPRFEVLHRLDGWLLSGEVGVIKPDPEIYAIACERFDVDPSEAVFIDDRADNVAAAQHFGLPAILFTDPQRLRAQLRALGLPLRAVS
ncbi:HAD family phosphatase [Candidatus Neomicrothrix sp.]|jgi:2-haloacid dehalogenase|uniref:HAD family phosphatase n=1 Tax=Candidatus Neomicrothrix subdominans TaxID=2954438 RepID=A0A936NA79_9ACTN|nr:HAD family phosphatase [Candidatus Microthrix sp.]MBK9296260.1 HAD family phosphatase [Candidatus Microthrix subdominans]MBK6310143.1 HAD family phosphatase [Candidatus Microthrix sp.]MBK6439353.1 HAD family phosphatase [Candidatus Microthrix sp.]MBK6967678.1 HAD family phosphatase [Candidatus Microthrix sp.]MBK7164707.1 HAD family phosphatase [Candidatus Microthrix sp.]